jgi:hypothetical protein
MQTAYFSQSTAATHAVVAAKPGYRIKVLGIVLSSAGTVTGTFQSASTALFPVYFVAGKNFIAVPGSRLDTPTLFESVSGEALNITLSDAIAVGGFVLYVYVP